MTALLTLLGLLVLLAIVYFVAAPLLARPDSSREQGAGREAELADLEARKEAKYREIRDTELDRASGKLSDEDFRHQDAELRREAVEILERIDQLQEPG